MLVTSDGKKARTMTANIRQARYRKKHEASGIVQVNVQVPAEYREQLRELAQRLRAGEPWPDETNAAELACKRDQLAGELERAQNEAQHEAEQARRRARRLWRLAKRLAADRRGERRAADEFARAADERSGEIQKLTKQNATLSTEFANLQAWADTVERWLGPVVRPFAGPAPKPRHRKKAPRRVH